MRQGKTNNQQGFTILELLIATAILSVVLLIATVVMISIGHVFYKGFTEASVQDDTRDIVNQLAQDVQFGGAAPSCTTSAPDNCKSINITQSSTTYTIQAFCVGPARYSFITGVQIGNNGPPAQIQHVLWRDIRSGSVCVPLNLTQSNPEQGATYPGGSGSELVGGNSRLTAFSIINQSGSYSITVGLANGNPNLSPPPSNLCTGQAGDQFCATDQLTTTVVPRIK